MRIVPFVLPLIAIAVALILFATVVTRDGEIANLRIETANLKSDVRDLREFNERLCRVLRDESIMVFATTPKTGDEKITESLEEMKFAVGVAKRAMASRDPVLLQRAEKLKARVERKMNNLNRDRIILALKAECEAAADDCILYSSLMLALGKVVPVAATRFQCPLDAADSEPGIPMCGATVDDGGERQRSGDFRLHGRTVFVV